MITLENIRFKENKDQIIIDFSYEGIGMNIDRGQLKMSKDCWVECKKNGVPDEVMIQRLFENEFSYLIDYMGD